MKYQAVIGLEVHAELQTESKMFCACPLPGGEKQPEPNSAVCPVCSGMPGTLPVLNKMAVEFAMRAALALDCQIQPRSIFARKNYFYPDLPKGYQISQYEQPLAVHGRLVIDTESGEKTIRIRRIHLEEDTGKLTHFSPPDESAYTLVDLNRSGVPLLEIVSEPDMNSAEEAAAYAKELRDILRAIKVNSGDMEKGVIRFEANVSLQAPGEEELGTRVEIKNLNTFRGMQAAIEYEIQRQTSILDRGELVNQETLGWDEEGGLTYPQRGKEEAHDYRYFPEPDLPPLDITSAWVKRLREGLPELPRQMRARLKEAYALTEAEVGLIAGDRDVMKFFESCCRLDQEISPRTIITWIGGALFAWFNTSGETILTMNLKPADLVDLIRRLENGQINQNSAKKILAAMLEHNMSAAEIIRRENLEQTQDEDLLGELIDRILRENPQQVDAFKNGKTSLENWFFGRVMQASGGKADPQMLKELLQNKLQNL